MESQLPHITNPTIKKEFTELEVRFAFGNSNNMNCKAGTPDKKNNTRIKRKLCERDFKIKLEADLFKACNSNVNEKSIQQEELSHPPSRPIFRKKWLELPEFKDWLVEGLHPYHGFCTLCNIRITAGKSDLLAHSRSKKHLKNLATKEILEPPIDVTAIVDESGSTHLLHIIDLRSDSLSVPSFDMKRAMIEAPTGDTAFNTDTSVKKLEESISSLLNKECGLFFPTHSMANLVACMAHCQARGSAVIAGEDSDVTRSNREALVKFGGLHFCPVKEADDGSFSTETLESLLKKMDLNFPLTCLVSVEAAHARKGGRVPSLNFFDQVGRICSGSESVFLHCDGTRLLNASLAFSVPPSLFVRDCDSVTVAIDKSLGAPLGAVLAGKEMFIKRAAYIRDFMGGSIHQAGTFAAAGSYALEHTMANVDWDHEKAKAIAIDVAKEDSSIVTVDIGLVQTNIVHLRCNTAFLNATQLKERLATVNEEETEYSADGENVVLLCEVINKETLALMLHNKLSHSDVRAAIKKLIFVINELENAKFKRQRVR